MAQAPSGFDELEPHVQSLPRSEAARSNRRLGKAAEPSFLPASPLLGSLHVGGSPHAVLDDSSVRHETILGHTGRNPPEQRRTRSARRVTPRAPCHRLRVLLYPDVTGEF